MKTYSNQKIKELLTKIIDNKPMYSKVCKVIKINEDDYTCDCQPVDGTPTYFDVRLSPVSNPVSVKIPNKDSNVIVSFLDAKTPYVSSMDDIDKYLFQTSDGTTKVNLKDVLTTFADDLKTQIDLMVFTTPSGPSTPQPLNSAAIDLVIQQYKMDLDKIFKS